MPRKAQAPVSSGEGTSTTRTVTLGQAAAPGNVLVVVHGSLQNSNAEMIGPGDGWTTIVKTDAGQSTVGIWWKYAEGGETSISSSITDSGSNCVHVYELTDVDPANAADVFAKQDSLGAVNAATLGPTANPAADRLGLAIAALWVQAGAGVGSTSWSNDFSSAEGFALSTSKLQTAIKVHGGGEQLSTSVTWGNAATSPRLVLANFIGPELIAGQNNELIAGMPF